MLALSAAAPAMADTATGVPDGWRGGCRRQMGRNNKRKLTLKPPMHSNLTKECNYAYFYAATFAQHHAIW